MRFICLFFPAIVMCAMRRAYIKETSAEVWQDVKSIVVEYACCCLLLNLFLVILSAALGNDIKVAYERLGLFCGTSITYLLAGVAAAWLFPLAERYIKEQYSFSVNLALKTEQPAILTPAWEKYGTFLLVLLALVIAAMHFIRIFDDAYWFDEVQAIHGSLISWNEMINYVAKAGHSPFHYALLWAVCNIFGHSGAVYHLVSVVPLFIILIFTVTVVRKQFGNVTAFVLMVLVALMRNAIRNHLEIRMYSWCQLFLFLTFLAAYKLYKGKSDKYFIPLTLASLGAVYAHYYALASVGIIYFFLLVYYFLRKRKAVWKVLISGIAVLMGLLPWFFYCYSVAGEVMHRYKLPNFSWGECFAQVFLVNTKGLSLALLGVFLVLLLAVSLRELGIFWVQEEENAKRRVNFDVNKCTLSGECFCLISCACAVIGTIAAAKLISSLVYPIIWLRYLYPPCILAWLALGIVIAKCPWKKTLATALAAVVIVCNVPFYVSSVRAERENIAKSPATLKLTEELVNCGGTIATDILHLRIERGFLTRFYYPKAKVLGLVNSKIPALEPSENNFLMISKPITKEMIANLKKQRFMANPVIQDGRVGTYKVYVYKLEAEH